MKIRSWFHVIAISSVLGFESASAQDFLTYEQVLQLSPNKRHEYLLDLQKIVLELSRQKELGLEAFALRGQINPLFNGAFFGSGIFLQLSESLLWPFGWTALSPAEAAESGAICELKSAQHLSTEDLLSAIRMYNQCIVTDNKRNPLWFEPTMTERMQVLVDEFNTRVRDQRINPRTPHYKDTLEILKESLKQVRSLGVKGQTAPFPEVQILEATKISPQQAPPPRAAVGTGSDVAISPRIPQPATQHQCLYSGFLIPKSRKGRCWPLKRLPPEFEELGVQMTCASPEQIPCNPLLFGWEVACSDEAKKECGKKPVCVFKSQDATKNCFESAQAKKTLSQTSEIWQSDQGKRIYEDYTTGLQNLCDWDKLKARKMRSSAFSDVVKTCAVAFKVLRENIANKYLPDLGLQENPDPGPGADPRKPRSKQTR